MGDTAINGLLLQSEFLHTFFTRFTNKSSIFHMQKFHFPLLNQFLDPEKHHRAERNEYNFDHPDAFDIDLMVDVLRKLKEGKKVEVPIYNFVTHQREIATKTMYGANVIIFEGILVFHSQEVVDMLDMKVFVDTDADIRLARRLKR